MSPEIKQIILKNFEFFLTFGTLLVWMVLIRYTWPLIALIRKFVLALFSFLFFKTWVLYVSKGITYLEAMDADGFLRRRFGEYKGTDWGDGFLWGVAIALFVGIVLALWAKDLTTRG